MEDRRSRNFSSVECNERTEEASEAYGRRRTASPGPHTVRFHADGSGPAPLAWGQLAIWDVLRWLPEDDDSLNLLEWLPAPPGTRVDQAADALRVLVERHQSLRTLYFEQDGGPTQRVLGEGELTLEVTEASGPDTAKEAEVLGRRLLPGAFDTAHELPVRAAIVTRQGQAAAIVLVFSHMAVDGWSFQVITRDLRALLSDPSPSANALAARARQPADRASFERSSAGLRREAATLRHWERKLRAASPTMLEKPAGPEPAGRDWATIDSPAMALAAEVLATRVGTNPGTALISALALLLAFRVGEPEATLRLIVATRFAAEDRDYVGAFNQNGLLHVPVRDEPLEDYLRRAATAVLAAHRRCEADPRKVERLVADIAAERGFVPDSYCFFNDIRFDDADRTFRRSPSPPGDATEAVVAALPRTRLTAPQRNDRQKGAKLFVFLNDLDETCRLTLCLDPSFLGPYRATELLADLERLLTRAAVDPTAGVDGLRRSIAEGVR